MTLFTKYRAHLAAVAVVVLMCNLHCSSPVDQYTIESEPVVAMIGGTVLATQASGLVGLRRPLPRPFSLDTFLNPISIAHAAQSACPALTTIASCVDDTGAAPGPNLQVFYDNCQSSLTDGGFWRSYFYLTFDSQASCDAIRTSGFGSIDLTGQSVVRHFGSIQDDQNNIRVSPLTDGYSEVAYLYSRFPSGWQVDKSGGPTVTFTSANNRKIVIGGMHAKGYRFKSVPVDTSSTFDLTSLSDTIVSPTWDHTINTVKTGDALFGIGPVLVKAADGSVSFGDNGSNTTAGFDGDLIVVGNTVKKGGVLRVQQNIAQAIAVVVITEDLVYSDPNCCWPTSGAVESRFDFNDPAPTTQDKLQFLATECGAIDYTTDTGSISRTKLSHCF